MNNVEIKTNEHVLIVGTTGSGKSFFAENYLRFYDSVVKLDTKNEVEERREQGLSPWRGLIEGTDFEVVHKLEDLVFCKCEKIIYAPVFEELDEDFYNEFFRWCFERKNTIVWIDELMSITSAQRIPDQLKRILTQGRSKNVSAWCCSQRPSGIPMIIPSNCSHFITYYLNWSEDRKKMVAFTGCEELLEPLEKSKFYFWYCSSGMEHAFKGKLKI